MGLIISYRNSHHIKGAELKIKAEVKHQEYIGFSQWCNVTKKVGPSLAPIEVFYIFFFIDYFVIVRFFDVELIAPLSSVTVRVTE